MKNKKNNLTNLFISLILIFILIHSIITDIGVEFKIVIFIASLIFIISFYRIKQLNYEKDNIYYEGYLKSLTDTLAIATKEMRYVESVYKMRDKELLFHLGVITGCQKYLDSINPPLKYEKEHKEIINDLYYFVEDNKLRLNMNEKK